MEAEHIRSGTPRFELERTLAEVVQRIPTWYEACDEWVVAPTGIIAPDDETEIPYFVADGRAPCMHCGFELSLHPSEPRAPESTLCVLCDGSRAKL